MTSKKVKAAGEKPAKPEEYQRFEQVLKKVIKAPPMKRTTEEPPNSQLPHYLDS